MSRLKQLLLAIGDILMLYMGLYLAVFLRYPNWHGQELMQLIKPMTALFLLAAITIFIIGLYDLGQAKNNKVFYKKILTVGIIWLIVGILYFYITPNKNVSPKTILLLTAILGFGLISFWRYIHNKFISTNIWQTNLIFIGMSDEAEELIDIIQKEPQRGYVAKGIITKQKIDKYTNIPNGKNIAEIKEKNQNQNAQLIILSHNMADNQELLPELYSGLFKQIGVLGLAEFYEEITHRIPPFTFSAGWFITNLQEQKKKIYDQIIN